MSGNPSPPVIKPSVLNASALLAHGLSVTSTATSSLNGTYATDDLGLKALQAEMDSLTRNSGTFTDGGTTVNWPDVEGAGHSFDVAQFGTLINAINKFVVDCYQYAEGITTSAPAPNATIP